MPRRKNGRRLTKTTEGKHRRSVEQELLSGLQPPPIESPASRGASTAAPASGHRRALGASQKDDPVSATRRGPGRPPKAKTAHVPKRGPGRPSKTAWKAHERDSAAALGGRRVSRADNWGRSDTDLKIKDFPHWQIDCKYRQSFLHHSLLDEIERKYCKEPGQVPVLITKQAHEQSGIVSLRRDDLGKLLNEVRAARVVVEVSTELELRKIPKHVITKVDRAMGIIEAESEFDLGSPPLATKEEVAELREVLAANKAATDAQLLELAHSLLDALKALEVESAPAESLDPEIESKPLYAEIVSPQVPSAAAFALPAPWENGQLDSGDVVE